MGIPKCDLVQRMRFISAGEYLMGRNTDEIGLKTIMSFNPIDPSKQTTITCPHCSFHELPAKLFTSGQVKNINGSLRVMCLECNGFYYLERGLNNSCCIKMNQEGDIVKGIIFKKVIGLVSIIIGRNRYSFKVE